MTTDITELAQLMKAAAVRAKTATEEYASGHMSVSVCFAECEEFNRLTDGPDNILALVEALEKAQQERENWRTSFDNERFRADKLKAYIDDMEPIRAAAEKLVRCKGRYHSEQNYRALAALFGVNTPDLPPLEHENVHYADAAEMEIAALRQRIVGLEESNAQVIQSRDHYKRMTEEGLKQLAESRAVTVKLPQAVSAGGQGYQEQVERILTAAGIKVEAE
ncbi:TPA: ead/Ea22-like family protein [Klebsiella pneumoniae subsp. pneumoniae]|nr:ead/Ea22-like family protein [Klebsiella pneumoniae subsp. pneumoniae]